MKNIFA